MAKNDTEMIMYKILRYQKRSTQRCKKRDQKETITSIYNRLLLPVVEKENEAETRIEPRFSATFRSVSVPGFEPGTT
ncbi:MAG: hypothetical protein LUE92_17095 [Clostridiales bacterium]|nr:hypothetical protein [Clostridiales bacterium]